MVTSKRVTASFLDGQTDDPIGAALRVTYDVTPEDDGGTTPLMITLSHIPYDVPTEPVTVHAPKRASSAERFLRWCRSLREPPGRS